jgi:ATP-dependent DNA helicase RecG
LKAKITKKGLEDMFTPLCKIGVTERKEKQFNTKDIYSVEELAEFLPIGYRDYTKITEIKNLNEGEWVSVYGEVVKKLETSRIYSVIIKDSNNDTLRINWFGGNYHYDNIELNSKYVFCGKISSYGFISKELCMNTPEAYSYLSDVCRIMPRYSAIKGMSKEYLAMKVRLALEYLEENPGPIDEDREEMARKFNLIDRLSALKEMHSPESRESYKKAKTRFNFDVLYDFYTDLLKMEESIVLQTPIKLKNFKVMDQFIKELPFKLTKGQSEALDKLKGRLINCERVNGLLLGDVGSGKTIIAVSLAVGFCENKYQVAMLSPTQVLANQNYETMKKHLEPLGFNVALITAGMKTRERRLLLKDVCDGAVDVLVGTHAVLSDNVKFNNIGLTIIDEEHRFGVLQKEAMYKKISEGVNNLSMSATPIPRSLALSIYGNSVDVFIVDTMPEGRMPVKTKQIDSLEESYNLMVYEIKRGRQCYVICPLIEDSEAEGFSDVDSVNSTYEKMSEYFKSNPNIKIDKISGRMKDKEVDDAIKRFLNKETDILISTTIVEVGVNVPNASVIVINSADRFGLAQLHQLRGRVGRGKYQSYCLLVSDKDKERLNILCKTTNGFEIADEDLKLRGAGKLTGISQTGYSSEIMTIMRCPKLAFAIKNGLKNKLKNNSEIIA